jgi:hypothetical protein
MRFGVRVLAGTHQFIGGVGCDGVVELCGHTISRFIR